MTATASTTVQTEVHSYFEAGKVANARVVGLAANTAAGSNFKYTLDSADTNAFSNFVSDHNTATAWIKKQVEQGGGGEVRCVLDFGASTTQEFHTVLKMVADGIANVLARAASTNWKDFAVPTLTTFSAPFASGAAAAVVEVTKALIDAQGNEAAAGSVAGYVVQAVSLGTLTIGASVGVATAYAAGTNDLIDATHNAYWTVPAGAGGAVNAFTVKAIDDKGWLSATAIQGQVTRT